jgi:hypothetical protein
MVEKMVKIVGNVFITPALTLNSFIPIFSFFRWGPRFRVKRKLGQKGFLERSKIPFNKFRASAVRIIHAGNFTIICAIIFFTTIIDARVSMAIRPENGVRDQVVVGQPFVIDVTIDDVYGSVQPPVIKGLDRFAAQRTGVAMTSVNGKSNTRYSYQVCIDALGVYTIGPAVVRHQQQELVSNTVNVAVVKDISPVASQGKNGSQQEQPKVFLRLMVNAESVVVGQKIECALRFYYQDRSLSLNKIGQPELPGFDVKNMSNLENGVADSNGAQYYYAQWRWDMYPTKPGEFIIPAYNIDYEVPIQDNRVLGGFFMFMNSRADRKRVYSNAITIKVLPLPHYDGRVDGIGVFERMTAEIKPGMAKEGEGMVLALEIEGIGNLDAIAVPTISMPKALKYYDSNSAVIAPKNSDELPKKRFEFIVQGMEYGDWEIPEQSFTYFDIEKNAYATLRTSPLVVSIMPGSTRNKKNSVNNSVEDAPDAPVVVIEELQYNIGDINSVGQWYPVEERQPLQWWLFYMLFLMPCLYVWRPTITEKLGLLSNKFLWERKRRAFKQARKKLEQSLMFMDDSNLHAIFVELFSSYGQLYSLKDAATVLRTRGLSLELVSEWNNFVDSITHAAYAKTGNKSDELCRMAKQWIDRLEKIL